MSALSFNVNSTVPGSFTITFEPEPVVDLKVFDEKAWLESVPAIAALKDVMPDAYATLLSAEKDKHALKLAEADKVEWMERTGYSKLIEQRKIIGEKIAKLEQSEEGIKHLGSATGIRKVTPAGKLSAGMASFIRRLEARAPLGKTNAHNVGHKCLSCSKFYIGKESNAWQRHKSMCQDVKEHKDIWVRCVRDKTDTIEIRKSWRPS